MVRICISLIVFCLSIIQANEIDSMKTDEDVNKFMDRHFGDKYSHFIVADTNFIWYSHTKNNSFRSIADSIGMKFWCKADFNNDSKTDLLVYGSFFQVKDSQIKKEIILGIIDNGDARYQGIPIYSNIGPPFPIVKEINSECLVLLYKPYLNRIQKDIIEIDEFNRVIADYDYSATHYLADTLVYRFGTFIEYNSNPLREEVIEVTAKNSCSYLACYVMDIKINVNGSAEMLGGEYYEEKFLYKTQIDSETVDQIFELVNYINPKRLMSIYPARVADASSVTSTFTYKNGTIKEIVDYRKSELGLQRLYDLIFFLKDSQHWVKID